MKVEMCCGYNNKNGSGFLGGIFRSLGWYLIFQPDSLLTGDFNILYL
jgi:hypothetical protein